MDGRTESNAYDPTVQYAQVGSKITNAKHPAKFSGKDNNLSMTSQDFIPNAP